MDKQQLNDRIAAIKNEMETMKTNYIKLDGHLAETIHWLNELEKKEIVPQSLPEEKVAMIDC